MDSELPLPTRATAGGLSIPSRSYIRRNPIVGERIILTPMEPDDGAEFWQVVEASRWHLERWLPWVPFNNTPEASQRYVEACAADWNAGRAHRLGIREPDSGALLGIVGLDSVVHLHRACELGYWIRGDAAGKGLMTDAARALAQFGFDQLGLVRIRCAAATDNYASLRVIARLGFRFEGIARQAEYVGARWVDHAIFARLSRDA